MKGSVQYIAILLILSLPFVAYTQSDILDQYIAEGLQENLTVNNQKLSIEKSLEAIKEAKANYYPQLSLQARYSIARGGRTDSLDVGTIFEDIPNLPFDPTIIPPQTVNFLRETEHETKLRLQQPLFEPQIFFNHKIRKYQAGIEYSKLSAEKRQLVADIKKAYFQYLITLEVEEVLEESGKLLEENLRVTKSLVKNGKLTHNRITRVEAEMAELDKRKAEAERDQTLAKANFNLLLNKSLSDEIIVDENLQTAIFKEIDLETATKKAKLTREEFDQIKYGMLANTKNAQMNKWNYAPKVVLVADYGFQGVEYEFNKDQDFFIGSLVLRWTFFDGMGNKAKATQAKIETYILENRYEQLQQQIELQVLHAYMEVETAEKTIEAGKKKQNSAEDNYRFVQKQYEQNLVNQIEYLDAQTTLTQARIERIIANYNYWMALAHFEYVSGQND